MSNKNKRTNEGGNARPDRAKLVGAGPLGSELSEILMLDEREKVRDFFEQERQAADERSAAMRPAPQMIEGGAIELAAVPERLEPTHPRSIRPGDHLAIEVDEEVRLEPGEYIFLGLGYRVLNPVLMVIDATGDIHFMTTGFGVNVEAIPVAQRSYTPGELFEKLSAGTYRLEPGVHRIMGADYRTKYPVLLAVNESGGFKFKKPADAMSVDVEGVGAVPNAPIIPDALIQVSTDNPRPGLERSSGTELDAFAETFYAEKRQPSETDAAYQARCRAKWDQLKLVADYKQAVEGAAERAKVGDVPFLPAQLRTEEPNPYGFEPPATMQQVRALASGYQSFVIDLCRNAGSSAGVGQVNLPGKDLAQLCAAIVGDPTAGHILKDETWDRPAKIKTDRATALRLLCRAAMNLPSIHPCGNALTEWAHGLVGPAGKELIPMAEACEKLSLIAAALEGEHEEKSKAAAKLVTEAIKVLQ